MPYDGDGRIMRVVNTDNFGGDYPDEKFCSGSLSPEAAKKLADKMNGPVEHTSRYFKVVDDTYVLQPGFEP